MLSPLNLERNIVTLPQQWINGIKPGMSWHPIGYFLNDQECLGVSLVLNQERTTLHLYELVGGVWKKDASSTIEGPPVSLSICMVLLTNYRLYIVSSSHKILLLDLISLVISVIELPDGVELKHYNLALSQ